MEYLALNQITLIGTVIDNDKQTVFVSESYSKIERGIN